MKKPVLVLNRNWLPINANKSYSDIFIGICSGAFKPVDIVYSMNEDDVVDLNTIESMNAVENLEEWGQCEIRPYDEFVNTPKRSYRMPSVVVCANFNQIPIKRAVFPTQQNIWKRDKYTCLYTGEKLTREELSIDHVIPSSRGGGNTWENLATASKAINHLKADRTPKEAGLTLIYKPFKPKDGMTFDFLRDEWKVFLDGGSFE